MLGISFFAVDFGDAVLLTGKIQATFGSGATGTTVTGITVTVYLIPFLLDYGDRDYGDSAFNSIPSHATWTFNLRRLSFYRAGLLAIGRGDDGLRLIPHLVAELVLGLR